MDIHSFIDQPTSLRQKTIYQRSYERNIPSQPLQPYLEARPVLTKYAVMPIVDNRSNISTPLNQYATYTPETIYNPGNDFGPWSGYASNVNHESELRNQIFALQSCSQATYVPSSKSSLYDVQWKNNSKPQQPFPELFKNEQFSPFNPNLNPNVVGYALFNNATRQQVKDLTDDNNV
jgi:hypothetical protein